MSTFYISFCHFQLHQYGPNMAWFFKVKSEFLQNLGIAMKKKLVLYQPLLRKSINLGMQLKRGRVGGFPCFFLKIDKKYPNFGKYCPVCVHLWIKFSF